MYHIDLRAKRILRAGMCKFASLRITSRQMQFGGGGGGGGGEGGMLRAST